MGPWMNWSIVLQDGPYLAVRPWSGCAPSLEWGTVFKYSAARRTSAGSGDWQASFRRRPHDGALAHGALEPGRTDDMIDTVRKLLALFEPEEYWKLVGIVLAIIVTGLMQTVGIASIIPFIAVVSNPALVLEDGGYLHWAYEVLGFTSTRQFLFALGLLFIVVMVSANAFSAFTSWITARLSWSSHHRIAQRLLQRYVNAPYGIHLERSTATLAKSILDQVRKVIGSVLLPAIEVLARGVAAAFILALLIVVDPLASLVAAVTLGAAYGVAYLLVRVKQKELGAEQLETKIAMYRVTQETFGGIKDIKVLGREGFFLQRFSEPSARYSEGQTRHALLGLIPRFALETLAFCGVIAVVLYLLQTRETLDEVFPVLAVYGIAANRLMPSLQHIFMALTKIRFGTAFLDDLYADLKNPELTATEGEGAELLPGSAGQPEASLYPRREIRFRQVTFRYPRVRTNAIQEVDLVISANQTVGLVGSTGGGKTTLADLLLGLFTPTEGEILVDDVVLNGKNLREWRSHIGYVPQSIFLSDDTIERNIAFGIPDDLIDREAVEAAARAAHLDPFVEALPHRYETCIGERGVRISGGQRQRIGIARALYHNPPVLVMDEATSALDNVTEDTVMQAITELAKSRTIVLIAHRLTTVQQCDVIFLIEHGRVTGQGTYQDLVESSPTFRAMART